MKCCKKPECTSEYCESHDTCSDKCQATPVVWDVDHQTVTITIPFAVFEGTLENSHISGKNTFEQLHYVVETMRITKYEEA